MLDKGFKAAIKEKMLVMNVQKMSAENEKYKN